MPHPPPLSGAFPLSRPACRWLWLRGYPSLSPGLHACQAKACSSGLAGGFSFSSTCCTDPAPRPDCTHCLLCPPITTLGRCGERQAGRSRRPGPRGPSPPWPERRSFSGTPDEVWPSGKCRSEGQGGEGPGPGPVPALPRSFPSLTSLSPFWLKLGLSLSFFYFPSRFAPTHGFIHRCLRPSGPVAIAVAFFLAWTMSSGFA